MRGRRAKGAGTVELSTSRRPTLTSDAAPGMNVTAASNKTVIATILGCIWGSLWKRNGKESA
jgi:hypothetical protein